MRNKVLYFGLLFLGIVGQYLTVQRDLGFGQYSLSSVGVFDDSWATFERFYFGAAKKYLTSEKKFLILKIPAATVVGIKYR